MCLGNCVLLKKYELLKESDNCLLYNQICSVSICIKGYTGEIAAGIAGGALVMLILVSLVLYRNWRYEQELDSLLWKVDFKEIQMHENDKENNSQQKQTRVRF